ncbi:MAG: hypothetical protein KTR25_12735 [Myxococcales bacterium]|nr:hypothetical protein [Myxococcales bacterium]
MLISPIHMFFEGPEKKVEISLVAKGQDLRSLPETYWAARVQEAGAHILSTLHNNALHSFLLSESSLFVFPRKVVMITCGRTDLAAAAETMLRDWADEVDFFIYERKNEHFPEYQPTSFLHDARRLARHVPASGWRFGAADSHRIQILSSQAPIVPDAKERTLEILMHGIHPDAAAVFGQQRITDGQRYAAFRGLLAEFEVDEHWFEPTGYSVNALQGDSYVTIHVTPEQVASYVSFETNLPFGHCPKKWVEKVQQIFEPQALDVMTFSPNALAGFALGEHHTVNWVEDILPCGFRVTFRHLEQIRTDPAVAFHLPLGT